MVGDASRGRVASYDASWTPGFALGVGDGEFGHPGDIEIDAASGEVYVSDTARHVVKVYSAAGVPLRTIGSPAPANDSPAADGQLRTPTGLVLAGSELLVADQMNYRVQAFDKTSGAFLYCIGTFRASSFFPPSSGPARTFGMSQGLWVDALGRLYVADAYQGQVAVFDRSNGARIGTIGIFGSDPGALRNRHGTCQRHLRRRPGAVVQGAPASVRPVVSISPMPFDCRHRQRFGPDACLSGCPAAPPVFQTVRVQRRADVPPPEPHLVDIAVLDMHHGWPNLGHDAILHAMQNALCDLSGPLTKAGIGFRAISYDIRRGEQVIPEPPGGRHVLYVGTGGPGYLDPRMNDGHSEGSQGIDEDPNAVEIEARHLGREVRDQPGAVDRR